MDGSITRGFGGASIFFENGTIKNDLGRVAKYARLLSSVRINGIIVNNVNADATLLLPAQIDGLRRIANQFRSYGIRIGISLNFASPTILGNLTTFDPESPAVQQFWNATSDAIYAQVPDFIGYLVKANSEGM